MGPHLPLLLVSGPTHRRVRVHDTGAQAETGGRVLPPPTQDLFWLTALLLPVPYLGAVCVAGFPAVGAAPVRTPSLLLQAAEGDD